MNQYPNPQAGYPQQPQGYPQAAAYPQAPMAAPAPGGSSGKAVAGVILMVFAVLMLLGTAFFGYFSVHNYGAAERIVAEHPDARFIGNVIERKARNQAMIAGVLLVFGLGLGGGGLALRISGKKKPAGPVGYPQQAYGGPQA